jgi:hypothetical protein
MDGTLSRPVTVPIATGALLFSKPQQDAEGRGTLR